MSSFNQSLMSVKAADVDVRKAKKELFHSQSCRED